MVTQFLFFLFLDIFLPILAWNEAITVSFNLLNFFAILFWIFSYASCRNGTKRNDYFYFLSPSLFQPILAWNDAIMVFFEFFCYFILNFLLRVGSERNETKRLFLFSISEPFPTYFGLKWCHNGIFLIFWIFLLFFWNFQLRFG